MYTTLGVHPGVDEETATKRKTKMKQARKKKRTNNFDFSDQAKYLN